MFLPVYCTCVASRTETSNKTSFRFNTAVIIKTLYCLYSQAGYNLLKQSRTGSETNIKIKEKRWKNTLKTVSLLAFEQKHIYIDFREIDWSYYIAI